MMIETIVTSAGVSLAVSLFAFEYRYRREQTYEEREEVREWYSEAAELSRNVQQTWRRHYKRPKENGGFSGFDEVKKKMKLDGSQLSNHASKSETLDVDDDIVENLEEAADYCRDLSDIRVYNRSNIDDFTETGEKVIDELEEVQKMAVKKLS